MDEQVVSLGPAELKVCHLVHSTKVGGVEVAAAALQRHQPDGIRYLVGVLSGAEKHPSRAVTASTDAAGVAISTPDCRALGMNNPLSVFPVAAWVRRSHPDILIASLWRSVLVGAFLKMVRPSHIFVVFVHNTRFKNILDRISHHIGFHFADAVFCDAEATVAAMKATPQLAVRPMHVVPLLARPGACIPETLKATADASRAKRMAGGGPIRFIYWGRMAGQKRLDRSLHLLAALVQRGNVTVRLDLIGPDEGQMREIQELAAALDLAGSIHWQGPADWESICEIARSTDFFLQLSDFEGLGMSVIEAMQLGLIPVVTPVGQIADFTAHYGNAIHYVESAQTAQSVLDVWRDPDLYTDLCTAALAEWVGKESLQDSFASACRSTRITERRRFRRQKLVATSR